MTDEQVRGEGFMRLAEYPGLWQSISEEELKEWTALLDLAGKKRQGRFHPPMEWMVHRYLIKTEGKGITDAGETYLGNGHHFRRMCDFFFNVTASLYEVEWNPHTCRIIDEFFGNSFIALLGSASASKSYTMAVLGVGMFMVNPRFTKVLVTCTTTQAGKGKIWGDIGMAWNQMEVVFKEWGIPLPGKLMSEPPMIRYHNPEYDPTKGWRYSFNTSKFGLELIATLQSSEKQAVAAVAGYHTETVIFLGDEWDTFSPALVETVTGNLQSNPKSKCVASLNISGRGSSGGIICTPVGGWETVDPSMDGWMGVHGPVLRFDAERSANVLLELGWRKNGGPAPKLWKGLATLDYIEQKKEQYGEDSIGWWMYVKAWPPPTGESRFIYSEMELTTQHLCDHKVTTWLQTPTHVVACDPDFTLEGDGACLVVLNVGPAQENGETRILCELEKVIDLDKYVTLGGGTKTKQIVHLLKRFMNDPEVGFEIKNLAIDLTGATSFADAVNEVVGTGWVPVDSRSKSTEMIVSKADTRRGSEVFESLLSEMWLAPKALVRAGQIKGLDAETRREMCLRCFTQSNARGRMEVESKKLMKKRNKKRSPNRADALFIGIHLCRVKHNLVSQTSAAGLKKSLVPQSQMQKFYSDNPHLKPKVPKWMPRPAIPQLKGITRPW